MIGIYFSGTGNTKHCVEKLVKLLDVSAQSFPLEHTQMIQILEFMILFTVFNCNHLNTSTTNNLLSFATLQITATIYLSLA